MALSAIDQLRELRENLALKDRQVDVLCDGMRVQREQIAELKESLDITLSIADFNFSQAMKFKPLITFRGREYGWRTKD